MKLTSVCGLIVVLAIACIAAEQKTEERRPSDAATDSDLQEKLDVYES